ncbi:hypothetical protein [Herbiconiux liukaitaii]|uniref:hypothetical protein n=1 Tax=Herbiconiux liukaitaii TaxID=3342799 RepID=UPI0035BB27AF
MGRRERLVFSVVGGFVLAMIHAIIFATAAERGEAANWWLVLGLWVVMSVVGTVVVVAWQLVVFGRAQRALAATADARLIALTASRPGYFGFSALRAEGLAEEVESLSGGVMGDERGIAWLLREDVMELWVLEEKPVLVGVFSGADVESISYGPAGRGRRVIALNAVVRDGESTRTLTMGVLPLSRRYTTENGRAAFRSMLEAALREGVLPEGELDATLLKA